MKKTKNKGVTMVEVIVAFAVVMIGMTMISASTKIAGNLQARAREFRLETQQIAAAIGDDLADDGERQLDSQEAYSGSFRNAGGVGFTVQGKKAQQSVTVEGETFTFPVYTN